MDASLSIQRQLLDLQQQRVLAQTEQVRRSQFAFPRTPVSGGIPFEVATTVSARIIRGKALTGRLQIYLQGRQRTRQLLGLNPPTRPTPTPATPEPTSDRPAPQPLGEVSEPQPQPEAQRNGSQSVQDARRKEVMAAVVAAAAAAHNMSAADEERRGASSSSSSSAGPSTSRGGSTAAAAQLGTRGIRAGGADWAPCSLGEILESDDNSSWYDTDSSDSTGELLQSFRRHRRRVRRRGVQSVGGLCGAVDGLLSGPLVACIGKAIEKENFLNSPSVRRRLGQVSKEEICREAHRSYRALGYQIMRWLRHRRRRALGNRGRSRSPSRSPSLSRSRSSRSVSPVSARSRSRSLALPSPSYTLAGHLSPSGSGRGLSASSFSGSGSKSGSEIESESVPSTVLRRSPRRPRLRSRSRSSSRARSNSLPRSEPDASGAGGGEGSEGEGGEGQGSAAEDPGATLADRITHVTQSKSSSSSSASSSSRTASPSHSPPPPPVRSRRRCSGGGGSSSDDGQRNHDDEDEAADTTKGAARSRSCSCSRTRSLPGHDMVSSSPSAGPPPPPQEPPWPESGSIGGPQGQEGGAGGGAGGGGACGRGRGRSADEEAQADRRRMQEALLGSAVVHAFEGLRIPRVVGAHRAWGIASALERLAAVAGRAAGRADAGKTSLDQALDGITSDLVSALQLSELCAVTRRYVSRGLLERPDGPVCRECCDLADVGVAWATWAAQVKAAEPEAEASEQPVGPLDNPEPPLPPPQQQQHQQQQGEEEEEEREAGAAAAGRSGSRPVMEGGVEGGGDGGDGGMIDMIEEKEEEEEGEPEADTKLEAEMGSDEAPACSAPGPSSSPAGAPAGDPSLQASLAHWLQQQAVPVWLRVAEAAQRSAHRRVTATRAALAAAAPAEDSGATATGAGPSTLPPPPPPPPLPRSQSLSRTVFEREGEQERAAGWRAPGRATVDLSQLRLQSAGKWLQIAHASEAQEGDWGLLAVGGGGAAAGTETGCGGGGTNATAGGGGGVLPSSSRQQAGAAGGGGSAAAGTMAVGGGRLRTRGSPVLAGSDDLCELLARRFEYRWPVAAVGAPAIAAVLRLYAGTAAITKNQGAAIFAPIGLRAPPPEGGYPETEQRLGERDVPAHRRWRNPTAFSVPPGRPPCAALQFLDDREGNPHVARVPLVLHVADRSFDALLLLVHTEVDKRGRVVLICASPEDVALAVLVCAKVRDLMLVYDRKEVACVAELEYSNSTGREWVDVQQRGGWAALFRRLDDGDPHTLGHMRITVVTLAHRRGIRVAVKGDVAGLAMAEVAAGGGGRRAVAALVRGRR